ncbi:peptidoglycan editing factor PgeF [Thermosynechococcaceae cyanobacterium Okahandja]
MWHWQTTELGEFLTCDLLSPFRHGFFSRAWQGQPLATLTAALGTSAMPLRTQQVHGNRVVLASDVLAAPNRLEADALVSTEVNQALWVCSADCVPLLIGDPVTGQVAAIHAGWRGTAAEVAKQTITQMQALGSKLAHLRVVLGPAIRGDVYQVGLNVAYALAATVTPQVEATMTAAALYECLAALDAAVAFPDPDPQRLRVDVARVNWLQLRQLGLAEGQMAVSPYCTYRDTAFFFSYRRERQKQVQWSGIISR